MNLEIKDWRVDLVFPKVIELIEKYDYFDQIAISSFNHQYYQKIAAFNQNNALGKNFTFKSDDIYKPKPQNQKISTINRY